MYNRQTRYCHSSSSSRLRPGARAQSGLTLIELLVAMTLALMTLGVVATLFAGTSRGRADLERSNRLAENVHYGIEYLGDEIRHAGYFAELNFTGATWQVPSPCTTAADALGFATAPFTAPVGIAGYRPADVTPACLADRKPGTAAFVVRRLATEPTPLADANDAAFVQISNCNADLPAWTIGTKTADFTLRKIDCKTAADVRRVLVRAYYVATCNECGVDTTPTLKRVELVDGELVTSSVVEGIDGLTVEYGFDTDGDGNADTFLDGLSGVAGAADNDWSNVVAVRVYLLARSADSEPQYADTTKQYKVGPAVDDYVAAPADSQGYKRTLLSSLVRLNNPAGRRETP